MSEEDKSSVTKSARNAKIASIISAVIVLIRTLVDIFFN